MDHEINWDEYNRRKGQPRNRDEAIKADTPYVLVEHRREGSATLVWIEAHTGGNDGQFEIERVREGEPMSLEAARAQAHDVANQRGIGLVVIKTTDDG